MAHDAASCAESGVPVPSGRAPEVLPLGEGIESGGLRGDRRRKQPLLVSTLKSSPGMMWLLCVANECIYVAQGTPGAAYSRADRVSAHAQRTALRGKLCVHGGKKCAEHGLPDGTQVTGQQRTGHSLTHNRDVPTLFRHMLREPTCSSVCQPRSREGCRPGASRRIRAHLIT